LRGLVCHRNSSGIKDFVFGRTRTRRRFSRLIDRPAGRDLSLRNYSFPDSASKGSCSFLLFLVFVVVYSCIQEEEEADDEHGRLRACVARLVNQSHIARSTATASAVASPCYTLTMYDGSIRGPSPPPPPLMDCYVQQQRPVISSKAATAADDDNFLISNSLDASLTLMVMFLFACKLIKKKKEKKWTLTDYGEIDTAVASR